MCGISGLVDHRGVEPIRLERSACELRHRGPDDLTTWTCGWAGVAHTRLAIIDRAHGTQPIHTSDGRYVAVFNGEIYNHAELRDQLIARGYPIRTRCDSEVLPYLYDAEGPSMVDRLRGMFAFAIIDRSRKEVFLARDRFGKKPLYMARTASSLAFASTLDALLPLLPARPRLNPQAIAEYLELQYVPADVSPWMGTEKVEPGTWVRWSSDGVERSRYWVPPLPRDDDPGAGVDRISALRSRIREAVAARLESEVPLGVFLSGGLDSSIVVAEMSHMGLTPKTYSVGFQQAEYDERSFAELVADHFRTDHQTLIPEMDVEVLFEDFARAYDEPFADSSALATLAVAEAASRHVTVVLTGDGSDELFGGYDRYRVHRVAEMIDGLPASIKRSMASVGAGVARRVGSRRIAAAASFVATDPWDSYREHMFHFRPPDALAILSPDVRSAVDELATVRRLNSIQRSGRPMGGSAWMPWIDAQSYLPDDLLTKMDRATMAFGIEARSPFLDHDLWSYVAGIRRSSLLNARQGKLVLRAAYGDVLPAPIIQRAKRGFGVPIAAWMRTHLREAVQELLLHREAPVGGILHGPPVRELVSGFLDGSDADAVRVWNLLALAGWHEARVSPRGV